MQSFCFRGASEIWSHSVWILSPQIHSRDIINILLTSFFSVRTVSYGSSFFPLRFMTLALRAWAINRGGKNSVRNLRYGPRTRLVRGIYLHPSSYSIVYWLSISTARWMVCGNEHIRGAVVLFSEADILKKHSHLVSEMLSNFDHYETKFYNTHWVIIVKLNCSLESVH